MFQVSGATSRSHHMGDEMNLVKRGESIVALDDEVSYIRTSYSADHSGEHPS